MVIEPPALPNTTLSHQIGYRLISSKYPPINLFDDVADNSEFELLFELQAMTNPRIQNEIGNLNLLPVSERPFGIPGCSYAMAPFTHINPDGSRFSDGDRGMLYIADSMDTALMEVTHHQISYWQKVEGLRYDRLVLRGLFCDFSADPLADAKVLPPAHAIYNPDDYSAARALGAKLRSEGMAGIQYLSVRNPGATCWGLFTPRTIHSVQQTAHYEMIWNGETLSQINKIETARP